MSTFVKLNWVPMVSIYNEQVKSLLKQVFISVQNVNGSVFRAFVQALTGRAHISKHRKVTFQLVTNES